MNESLNDQILGAMCELRDLKCSLNRVNDIGEVTGFVEEHLQIRKDLTTQIYSIRMRIINLQQRINLHRKSTK